MDVELERSDWRDAPIHGTGTIFAIGDVHGCHRQLARLLEEFAALTPDFPASLVFLGDLICRGPSSLQALALWADPKLDHWYNHVCRLTGNHEQLLMLAIGDTDVAAAAYKTWMTMDGGSFVDELRRATGKPDAPLSRALLLEAAGPRVLALLDELDGSLQGGNLVFVHGGLDPALDVATALAAPRTDFGGNHWAWIQRPFLAWRGGFRGRMVIHGHTPPEKHRAMSGYADPHVFQHDRLSLDGGSFSTGIVAAAQIENGRYRLFKACVKI